MRFLSTIIQKIRNAAAFGAVAFLALPLVAHAAVSADAGLQFVSATGLTTTDVRTLVARIIGYFFGLLGLIAVALILYAGFIWMTAGGNEEKVKRARTIITQAIIGLVIILSAYAITQFIVRALEGGAGGGGVTSSGCPAGQSSCCPAGQVCAINLGGNGGFKVSGIAPAGAGPNNGGWPKNYAITAEFNAKINEASATSSSVEVTKCNARLDGSNAAIFRGSTCSDVVAGTITVDGSRIIFHPSGTGGDNPTDFEADFWYRIRLQGGSITDAVGRVLACPFQTADISSPEAGASYCERAMAFNAVRDVQPPTVSLNAPSSPPAYCASPTNGMAQVVATANDDFLVAGVDFLLDGGTSGLVDAQGTPGATAVNGTLAMPFNATSVNVDVASLTPGQHSVRATARDGVPQTSTAAEKSFKVVPAYCCNATKDGDETANDCGGACGSCNGDSCTAGDQCSSGVCTAGKCAAVPNIKSLSTYAGGVGTLVTVNGSGFGTSAGSVTFLGTDTDGNGDPAGDADDVTAQACAPQAWSDTKVVVAVPSGAVGGPLKLTTVGGSDRTDDTVLPPVLPNFVVNNVVVPGICYLSPSTGTAGSKITVNGAGFGQSVESDGGRSTVLLGAYAATVTTCESGDADCGWSDTKIVVTAPPIPEDDYPVTISVGANGSNPSNYLLADVAGAAVPRVVSVSPESAPVGSYVTILGSGFGSRKGSVRFSNGADVALGADPVCNDNWHDTYIIVKVPPAYQGGLDMATSAAGVAHGVQVITSTPVKSSNADVKLLINNDTPKPGICSIAPDNGPAGSTVTVKGEGFGSPQIGNVGPTKTPRFSVDFFQNIPATLYSGWSDTTIGTVVAGQLDDKATWPKTGPVKVISNNATSGNTVPFTVQDCRATGASCGTGTQCCANGSCLASCDVAAKTSAYGWQFSTSVLPSLPQVVERATCSASPSQMQSPSPTHDAQDTCVNSQLFFEFNRPLDRNTFTATTVKVEECGNGNAADCGSPVAVGLQSFAASNFAGCDSLDANQCRMFQAQPSSSYNGGLFKKGTWYRVTLVSDPTGNVGLHEAGNDGRYLDGDRDKKTGGNYVTTFRVRDSDTACEISNVQVIPSDQWIGQDTQPVGFNAGLLAGNCNLLQCGASQPYAISWLMTPEYLENVSSQNGACTQFVRAVTETQTGVPTRLTAAVSPLPSRGAVPKEGSSDVTIKFAEPRIVEVSPKSECSAACVNAIVSATFNVPMKVSTLNDANIQVLRCRNSSCSAPYLSDLGNGVTARATAAPQAPPAPGSNDPVFKTVTIEMSGNLLPATFYLVRVKGGASGVLSRSGVPLSGLNDGNTYSWKFRTKDDATACSVSRTTLEPSATTLRYVGDRGGLVARAFGSPDECSSGGQQLDAAAYNWLWSFEDPNRVLQGFVNGAPGFMPPERKSSPTTVVDTAAPRPGCTSLCTLTGSQDAVPQCGDGKVNAQYESCDDGNSNDGDSCRNNCTLTGTAAGQCGNGTVNAGEECDMIGGVWPKGCKQPGTHVDGFGDNIGCLFTGSTSAAGSMCGDGYIGDGEACDDSNSQNGDGCSSNCLKEGTQRSCLGAAAGASCINVCGNGQVEPGEDTACEPNPAANGCNVHTCLKTGTTACRNGVGAGCCGNGVTDKGEDAGCDTVNGVADHCTASCLVKGSSPFYAQPSFCGDGIVGTGEKTVCEVSAGDRKTDPFQAVVANVKAGFSASGANSSKVRATVSGVPAGSVASANVSLSCNCKNEPAGTQDAYCSSINPASGGSAGPFTDNLACADNGCCIARPSVVRYEPTSFSSCRNAEVTLVFSELMRADTLVNNFVVGYSNGTAACPSGTTEVSPLAMAENASWLQRLWNGIAGFVRNAVLRPVFGVSSTTVGYDREHFCSVPGSVTVREDGVGTDKKSVLSFTPTRALPSNKYIRVRLNNGALSASGVPLSTTESGAEAGYRAYFATGTDVCAISKVQVQPSTLLLAAVGDRQTISAHALAASGEAIVPTLDYSWTWSWDAVVPTSPIVVTPRVSNTNVCGLGSKCTATEGCGCFQGSTTAVCTVPNGSDSCTGRLPAVTAVADVSVRGSDASRDGGFVPVNSKGSLPINASAVIANVAAAAGAGSSTVTTVSSQLSTATASAVVLLCKNPWPKYTACTDSSCTADFWSPFHDTFTNVEFYYCRDLGTDTAATLPCLKETPATVLSPTEGILREYLFTYETNLANCPNGPSELGKWQSDAVGMRVASNASHQSISDWYFERGFRGSPTPVRVDGYEALSEGRTTYVNAGSKTIVADGTAKLYTNAYVLSSSEGSQTETTAIFNQILGNIDFNSNADLRDTGACRVNGTTGSQMLKCTVDTDCRTDYSGKAVAGRETFTCDATKTRCMDGARFADEAGIPIACSSDLDCLLDANDKAVVGRPTTVRCDIPKTKLRRDVKRWSDLVTLRNTLNTSASSAGSYPKLDSGTYLRTESTSAWPSWNDTFAKALNAAPPTDPLNLHGLCNDPTAAYDPSTCWDQAANKYMCPVGSHVYDYKSLGGTDYVLRSDFEYNAPGAAWGGSSCPERNSPTTGKATAACNADANCAVDGAGVCTFRLGRLYIGATVAPFAAANCTGIPQSLAGGLSCGDGVLQVGEACELGQFSSTSCDADPDATRTRAGMQSLVCNSTCTGFDPVGACVGGSCGDGLVQAPEKCDDGPLNGTFGHCTVSCGGVGLSCGDGQRSPNEACDCGLKNGQYSFNGIISSTVNMSASGAQQCVTATSTNQKPANDFSCAWDCSGAGPRCGDGIVNGPAEECDGGVEEFKGYCSDAAQTGCDTDAQCPSGSSCGHFCAAQEQRRHRACGTNNAGRTTDDANACQWADWVCTAPGTCGNGKKDTGEQCDDGNTQNNDACVIDPTKPNGAAMCKSAVCGDGFVFAAGGEECDDGTLNGRACVPEYGLNCNYCSSSCRVSTVSGAFCGDKVIQNGSSTPPGPEQCDGVAGLGTGTVCVSQQPWDQPFGVITGIAGCVDNSCLLGCADPNSQVCSIGGGNISTADNKVNLSVNADNNPAKPISGIDYCPPGLTGELLALCQATEAGTAFNRVLVALDKIGLTYLRDNHGSVVTDHNVFRNSCDPDDDNDGVPDASGAECGATDFNTHGAYTFQKKDGTTFTIPAAPEICGDHVDNDCNGLTDNIFQISGQVVDGQSSKGVDGVDVKMYCLDKLVSPPSKTDGLGNYVVSVLDDPSLLGPCNKHVTVEASLGGYCYDKATQSIDVDLNGKPACTNFGVDKTVITLAPPPLTYTAVLTWKHNDMATHMRINYKQGNPLACTSGYKHIADCSAGGRQCIVNGVKNGVSCSDNSDCGSNLCACAAVSSGGFLDGMLDIDSQSGGPETTTIKLRPNAAYNYYAESKTDNVTSAALGAQVHVWGPGCSDHHYYDATQAVAATGTGSTPKWWRIFNMTTNAASVPTIKGGDTNACYNNACDGADAAEELNGVTRSAGPTPSCP